MVMSKNDFEIIDKVAIEHFKDGKIVTKCPHCGGEMLIDEVGTSYEVKCVNNCISDTLRGI